jgi:Flp pilus assembly pilin Flp
MPNLIYQKAEKGQGLVEYILIVALMGILAITAINKLSTQTQNGFTKATNNLNQQFSNL